MAHLRIARITYEDENLDLSEKGAMTIGQMIDMRIAHSDESFTNLHEITLSFEENDWTNMLATRSRAPIKDRK